MHRSGALPLLFILSTTLFHLISSTHINVHGKPTFGTIKGGQVDMYNMPCENGTFTMDDVTCNCPDYQIIDKYTKSAKQPILNPSLVCTGSDNPNNVQPTPGNINNDNPGNYSASTNNHCYINWIEGQWVDPRLRSIVGTFINGKYEQELFKCYGSGMFGLEAIVVNSVRYEYLKCNRDDGWRGVNTVFSETGEKSDKDYPIGDAYIMPQLSCIEYCVPPTDGFTVDLEQPNVGHASWIRATCLTEHNAYGEKKIANSANCTLEYGWYNENGLITTDTTTKPQIDCRNNREGTSGTTTTTPKTAITSTTTMLLPSLTENKPIKNSKFAASEADAPGVSTATIVGCSIGGIALFAIVAVVIFLMVKKRQNEDGSGIEQGKRTKENNDEILDEIKVESTSEVNV